MRERDKLGSCDAIARGSSDLLLQSLAGVHRPSVLVVGDVMLDQYTWGDVERVSPEAPALVVRAERDEVRAGGAASVAALLAALDADVSCYGVVGDDWPGRALCRLLAEAGIACHGVSIDQARCTTLKHRLMGKAAGRHPHQIVRVDREDVRPIEGPAAQQIAGSLRRGMASSRAVAVSDYGKGTCTDELLSQIMAAARAYSVPVLIDPARNADYSRYRGATVLKPNRAEAEHAAGMPIRSSADALRAAEALCGRFDVQACVITLEGEGMALVDSGLRGRLIPARPREVYDVTGAGDTVLAALALCLAAGMELATACELANVTAGLQVERLGVALITREEIRAELAGTAAGRRARPASKSKICSAEELHAVVKAARQGGKRIVFTNGCFDILHAGHAAYLEAAAALGDLLIVAVNADDTVRLLKGPGRPAIGQHDRAALVAALACVDRVVVFSERTPHALLAALRPDVLVKGGDYRLEEVVGREVVEGYGGRVCVVPCLPGVSTSGILRQLAVGAGAS